MSKASERRKRLKEIGQRIANYRRHLSISQTEMAEKYHISKSVWSHYENGLRPFNIETAIDFAEVEKLGLDAIFRGLCRTEREKLMLRHPRETWNPEGDSPQK